MLMGFAIGATAGLRSMAPLAIVAWAAQSWPGVHETALAFMTSPITAWILTAFAVAELIPQNPRGRIQKLSCQDPPGGMLCSSL
jgi:uncharacterized membrane protein